MGAISTTATAVSTTTQTPAFKVFNALSATAADASLRRGSPP